MSFSVTAPSSRRAELAGKTVLVIGGSAGMGFATAVRARQEGAELILTARNIDRLDGAGRDLDARSVAAFDVNDAEALRAFFDALDAPLDHVMVTAGSPHYGRLMELEPGQLEEALSQRLIEVVQIARLASGHVRPAGGLLFVGSTGSRRPAVGIGAASAITAAMPTLIANLALELAPIRVNLIAAGFVNSGLSAAVLGDGLDARREQLRASLPIGRVIEPDDVARLAVHIMVNTALTGATFDIDGGQQYVE